MAYSIRLHNAAESNTPITLDKWLDLVGEFGRYQKKHFFGVHIPGWIAGLSSPHSSGHCSLQFSPSLRAVASMITYSMVFVNSAPGWSTLEGQTTSYSPVPCDSGYTFANPAGSVRSEWDLLCKRGYLVCSIYATL